MGLITIKIVMTIANSFAAKFTVAFVAIAMMFSVVAPAQAMTDAERDAAIDALMAEINALKAEGGETMTSSSDVCPYTWTRSLNMGATGSDVMKLQAFLNADAATAVAVSGAGSAGMETEYYGPATGAAVMKFQEMYRSDILAPLNLVNATTYFGPSTMAKANALCVSAPEVEEEGEEGEEEEETGSESLGNDEGSITVTGASSDESNLEEGMEGGILGFDVEIEGDVEINRVDVYAEVVDSTTASDNADDYFTEASLWVDGDKVATIDVDDFDTDNYTVVANGATTDEEYRLRFSGLDLVFADGDEPEFQVAFEVVNSLDSADLAADWNVELDSIRFVDGQGFTDSEDGLGETDSFGFDAEEVAELDITDSSDNPDATTLLIDDADDESDEYEVFMFEIEEKNGVDVTVEDLTFTVTTTGETDEAEVVEEMILYHGSTELDSDSVPTGGVVTFENLGIEIDADSTEEFTIAMIFKGADYAGLASDVKVELTSIDDAEDARGYDEGDMTIGGEGLESNVHTLRTVVPVVSDTSFDNDRNEAGDAGTISFEFTIGAEDDDYDFAVANKAAVDGTSDDIRFTTTGTDLTIDVASITKVSGDATATGAGWTIADGDEATFIMDVTFTTVDAGDNGTYRVTVDTVGGIEIDETSTGMNLTF